MTQLLRLGIGAIAGVFVLSGLGCSQKGPETAVTPPVAKPAGAKLRIVFIPKNSGNPYFDDVVAGFEEEAPKIGAEFSTVAPATGEATSQISTIKEQVQKGVDVIAIAANSPDALNAALDDARAKGVLVITVDADLDKNESHRVAAVLPTDFSKIGPELLDTLAFQLPDGGDFAILSATHDAPNQNAWIESIQALLKLPKHAKLHLVDIRYGDDQAEKSTTEADGLFAKFPNLRGIIAPTSAGLPAVAQALETKGLYPGGPHAGASGGIVLTGLATPNAMKKFVEKGEVAKFLLWSPHDMGVLACYLADALKSGKLKPDEGVVVDVPGLGRHRFGKKGIITAGPLITFDKTSVGKYNF